MSGLRLTVVDGGPCRWKKQDRRVRSGDGVYTYDDGIIEHPEHGLVLWDTGVNHIVADPEEGEKYSGPAIRDAFGAQGFTREHAIDKQLEKLGFKTDDVRYVVLVDCRCRAVPSAAVVALGSRADIRQVQADVRCTPRLC